MEKQEGQSPTVDKKEGVIEKAKGVFNRITDRRLRNQFQTKPEKSPSGKEEEIDDSLDEFESDEVPPPEGA